MGPSSFRKWYGHVCEIRSFLPCNTPVLALTATATTLTCSTIIKHLNMREPHMIQMSPNRLNIRYSVVNTSREATEAFQWLVEELGRLRRALPCVIVFCRSITTCSSYTNFFSRNYVKTAMNHLTQNRASRHVYLLCSILE